MKRRRRDHGEPRGLSPWYSNVRATIARERPATPVVGAVFDRDSMDAERREYLEMQLSAYLDGELTPQEAAEVEAWLASDPQAERLLASLRATVEAVHSLPRARASEELLGNLRTRLERQALLEVARPAEVVTRSPAPSWGKWVAAAAVIGLTFVAGYFTWTLRNEHQSAGRQYAVQDEKPRQLVYNEEGEKNNQSMGSSPRPAITGEAEHFDHSIAQRSTPPASPAPEPAGSPGEKLATADRLKTKELDEYLRLGTREGKQSASTRTTVTLDATAPEETSLAGLVARSPSSGESRPTSPGGMASAAGGRSDDRGFGRVVSGPAPSDGRTQVMTFAFADADSRAKAIELLQRRVRLGETDAPAKGGSHEARRSYHPSAQPERQVALEPKAAREAPPAAPSRSVSVHTRPAAQFRNPAADLERARKPQVSYGVQIGGEDLVGMDENELLLRELRQIEPIQVDRDAPVNVVRVNTPDHATAERLIAALGDQAKQGVVERNHFEAGAGDTLNGGAGADILRGEAGGRLGEQHDLGAFTASIDKAPGHLGDDHDADGDGIRADVSGANVKAEGATAALGKPFAQREDGQIVSTMPSAVDGVITWNVTPSTSANGHADWLDAGHGVANGVLDLNLRYSGSPQTHGALYDDGAHVPATSPAGSLQVMNDYAYEESSKGDVTGKETMGGVGMMGFAGVGQFGGYGGGGYRPGATTAPASSAASQPASRPTQRKLGENLLVVYFQVVPPETQPADRVTDSAPATVTPASQPAVRP